MNFKSLVNLRHSTLAAAALIAFSAYATAGTAQVEMQNGSSVQAESAVNPYSPQNGHPYRHGVIPTLEVQAKMKQWDAQHPPGLTVATGPQTLSYGGGVNGVGVLSGHSKVYLVFYGTQWGTQSTNANGDLTFSGDSSGGAPVAQEMFKGVGTGAELWSAELTQWCDGPNVTSGAVSCPANGNFIPYQSGGVLAGVWYDNSAASPAAATAAQLGQEAVRAATHFGNTTTASNRYTYYVIMSPHGTNPDNYQGQYCAWHDWTGDVGINSIDLAFSNQPYNTDSGAGCGVGFVNSPGTLDGYTMTLGHEWHETMSDQFPAGGWTNHTGSSYNGQENSDECAWIAAGQAGGAANVSMGTGTFTEQASWSNDTNSCAISHPIVGGGGGNVPPVAGFSFTTSGLVANFIDSSTDSDGTISSRAWTFGDGGTSTATNPSHTYAAAGTYSVSLKVTDNGGATNTKTTPVTVSGGGGGNVLQNGVPVTGLAATTGNQLNYTMVVPAGATSLNFAISGGTGDADMYVKFGSPPTLTSYDCRPYITGNNESCPITTAQAGTYYVMLNAYASFTGVSLVGSYSTGGGGGGSVLQSGVPVTGVSAALHAYSTTYTIVVPAGKTNLTVTTSGGTGDGDLYVRLGAAPTTSTYTCRSWVVGNTERCSITPSAGTYYIRVYGYTAAAGITLTATYSP
ncbi:MAG: pre-peptidase C-terminal domain-containing protein [Lysobacterales bacterium]